MPVKQELKDELIPFANGITGYIYGGGYLNQQDDTLLTRGGGLGLKIYDDIERDCHAFAVLQKRKLAVIARELIIEPFSKGKADKKAADMVKAQLANLSCRLPDDETLPEMPGFDACSYNMLDAILKGFSVGEIMWDTDGSEVYAAEVRTKDQRLFGFAPGTRGFKLQLRTVTDTQTLPGRKFIVYTWGAKNGNPWGLGMGSRLFWPVFFKRQGITMLLVRIDKFSQPTPYAEHPPGLSDPEKAKLLASLRNIGREGGILVPTGTILKYLEDVRAGQIDTEEKLARYMDEQMSECVLGETGSTNQSGNGGSRARDEVGNEVRLEIVKADADLLSATYNATLVRWITQMNMPGANPPKIWRDCGEPEDLMARAERDKLIFDMGFEPDEQYINDTYGGRWTKKALTPPPPALPGEDPGAISFSAGEPAAVTEVQLAGMLALAVDSGVSAWVEKLRSLGDGAADLAELAAQVGTAFPDMPVEGVAGIVAADLVRARMGGRLDVVSGE